MSTINLLPEDYLERRAQQRANILCLILFSIVMAGVVGAAVVTEEKARQTRLIRERVNRDYEEAGKLISQLQGLGAMKKDVIAKAHVAADLQERVPRSYLMATLTNALPAGASLMEVNVRTTQTRTVSAAPVSKFQAQSAARGDAALAAAPPPSVPPTTVTVEVFGLAQTDVQVAQFIATMVRNELMETVDLAYSEETTYDNAKVRKFLVSMVMKNEADVAFKDVPAKAAPTPQASAQPAPMNDSKLSLADGEPPPTLAVAAGK